MPKTTYATVTPMEGQYDQVPCCLFFQPEYRDLSLDAKLLYTRMLSLTSYASFKGREDKIGVYITMSRRKIMEYLGCAQQKATKVLRELLAVGLAQLDSGDRLTNLTSEITRSSTEIKVGKTLVETAENVLSVGMLTQALVELLIDRVYIYPGNRFEIAWKVSGFYSEDQNGSTMCQMQ